MAMNRNWRDIYDEKTDTHIRVSPEVLQHLGREGVLQFAQLFKARNPKAVVPRAIAATAYFYTANGMKLSAGLYMLEKGTLPVILISTREQWAEYCEGREIRN